MIPSKPKVTAVIISPAASRCSAKRTISELTPTPNAASSADDAPSPRKTRIDSEPQELNGKTYQRYVLRKAALFPSKTGEITIPSLQFEFVLGGNVRSFFPNQRAIRRATPEITIQVTDPPHHTTGLPIGNFTFDVHPKQKEIDINEILTVIINIQGSGNIKTITPPEFASTDLYKVYPAKITRNVSFNNNGVSGTVTAEIPISFKKPGLVPFPSLQFPFLKNDSGEGQLITLSSNSFNIQVSGFKEEQAKNISTTQGEILREGEDIDFIKKEPIYHQESFYHKTQLFLILLLLPFIFNLLYLLKKQVFDRLFSQNTRLLQKKFLHNTLKQLEQVRGYGEISPILEKYLKEKAGLGLSAINNQTIDRLLAECQVNNQDISTFLHLKNQSESSRFAPGESSESSSRKLKQDIKTLVEILKRIDSKLKGKK